MSGYRQRPEVMCEVFILAPADLVDEARGPGERAALAGWLTQQRGKPSDCATFLTRWLCSAPHRSRVSDEGHPL
jgi:hypothetical protein